MIAAILLGSDFFPNFPPDRSKQAFKNSADRFAEYLESLTYGLGIGKDRILNLFGSGDPVERQDWQITEFLRATSSIADTLLIYYVGHGGFLVDRQYFLTLKVTEPRREHFTGKPYAFASGEINIL